MTDFALPLPTTRRNDAGIRIDWFLSLVHTLRVRARLHRRRRFRDIARDRSHDWLLALPQSRHGG